MTPPPRLALATPSTTSEPSFAGMAMLAGLAERGWSVQHFRSRARPFGTETIRQITGLPERHLDAWLMPPEVLGDVFARGSRAADLAVVEGTLDEGRRAPDRFPFDRPGRLAPIAEALNLPVVGLVEAGRLEDFHLPRLPDQVEAVLIDGLERREDYEPLRRLIRLAARRPVLGAVEALPSARSALREASSDGPLPEGLVEVLSASFRRFADLEVLASVAESRPFPRALDAPSSLGGGRRFRVAYAQDDAFGGYFPDTLETLEALGADLLEFSPLHDGDLPGDVVLVMIGCGFPDRFADALAANLSLIGALKHHVCRGHRIYAEGGGTAYLGRSLVLDGRRVPGAGILPFDAELRREPKPPTPVSRTLIRDGWLGPSGTVVRGYRSGRWTLRPAPDPGDCPAKSGRLTRQGDVIFRHHAVGSLIHLHLASLPQVVRAFAGEHRPSLALPGPRS